ncbi:MAG TPA: hydrogenase maturation nickel metallochaperone HypA [Verrucomicrobiae bacterium]|jgi:hydrogenase nickel incorporation protein HypA/HybF|nr:hydrogenase maturation nickel metallochaperone HypA [Verrucomicrobiae bacterium]
MHEFGIAAPLLQAALEISEQQGGLAVEQIYARIGRLREIAPDALTFAFNSLKKGTAAEGATLVWKEIAPSVRCAQCPAVFQPDDDRIWVCPSCGAGGGELLAGNELIVERVILHKGS